MLKLRKMENSHCDFLYFWIFLFLGFFLRNLASNAQTNLDIERRQLPDNGAKILFVLEQVGE